MHAVMDFRGLHARALALIFMFRTAFSVSNTKDTRQIDMNSLGWNGSFCQLPDFKPKAALFLIIFKRRSVGKTSIRYGGFQFSKVHIPQLTSASEHFFLLLSSFFCLSPFMYCQVKRFSWHIFSKMGIKIKRAVIFAGIH